MKKVINFSGGKTSALMTIMEYEQNDIVIFCDTGREHPKTYKFINDFEAHENIPIIRLQYENGFEGMLKKWGNGNYGKKIPNHFKRQCTIELKVKTARRYLKSIKLNEYNNLIGFRYDEPNRVKRHIEKYKKVKTIFPLYEKKITKEYVNNFWSKKPYNLEIPPILGNCTLCFMKGKNAILSILTSFPELAEPWIKDEEASEKFFGHTYLPGIKIKTLKSIAENNLFKNYDLDNIKPAYDCACTS